MIDQNASGQESAASEAPETGSSSDKKARSPVERAIVWGGILILLGIAGLEYRAKSVYQSNFKKLSNALEAAASENGTLVEAKVKELVTGFSDLKTEALDSNRRLDTYTFRAVLKTHVFHVAYRVEGADGSPAYVIRINEGMP